jgi:acyl carrier protein
MTTKEKYDKVFLDCFSLRPDQLGESLSYQSVAAWDSVGHMGMIAALEEAFGIMMEMDDIIDFSSYLKGIDLLGKYNVRI